MGKLFFPVVLMLVLGLVWCKEGQPVLSDDDTVRELLELIRLMGSAERKPAAETGLDLDSPDELWSDDERFEKRDLPRLGVSIYRPLTSRVQSSKSMGVPSYRSSLPTERLARFHG